MINAAKYAAARLNGAFDVTIIVHKSASFRNMRVMVASLQSSVNLPTSNRTHFALISFPCSEWKNYWNSSMQYAEYTYRGGVADRTIYMC
jgi:hypothetical protein